MGNGLNTLFIVLLVITLVLFTVYYTVDSTETEEEFVGFNEITGATQSYVVFHGGYKFYHPTKKYTERYNEKLFDYLVHIQKSKDDTFHKGKVFLRE